MEYKGKKLRHEIKYIIDIGAYNQLKARLNTLMTLDGNSGMTPGYGIRSLYFDDQYNHAYYEKEDGVFERQKYRIRIYNGSDDLIKLELKEKFDKYIAKSSLEITRHEYTKLIQGTFDHEDAMRHEFLLEFYSRMRLTRMTPRIIVDYFREPFIHAHGNVRITFDYNLKTVIDCIDLFQVHGIDHEVLDKKSMILEVKYDDFLPKYIESALSLNHHQLISASKFVMCCDAEMALNWKELRR